LAGMHHPEAGSDSASSKRYSKRLALTALTMSKAEERTNPAGKGWGGMRGALCRLGGLREEKEKLRAIARAGGDGEKTDREIALTRP
jgi:hypothetical protein